VDELVVVDVVPTESEAELLCGLLRTEGIKCTYRLSNYGAGSADGMATGAQEVVVRSEDRERASELLGKR
jgi:hypothetical protein